MGKKLKQIKRINMKQIRSNRSLNPRDWNYFPYGNEQTPVVKDLYTGLVGRPDVNTDDLSQLGLRCLLLGQLDFLFKSNGIEMTPALVLNDNGAFVGVSFTNNKDDSLTISEISALKKILTPVVENVEIQPAGRKAFWDLTTIINH